MTAIPDWKIEKSDLIEGLTELGVIAFEAGKIIELCIYGGSCLMLVSDFRHASRDIDAVATTDQRFVDDAAARIAARRSWPTGWLNDGVRTYLSPMVDPPDHHVFAGTYPSESEPGLRVYVPTAEYMLAMKLMAMRIDEADDAKDFDDIWNLIGVVGITSKQALIALAAAYYPEAKVSAKLILSADTLVEEARRRRITNNEPPQYLGRSGASLGG